MINISKTKINYICEVDNLLGDASKAKKKLNWKIKNDLDLLIKDMIDNNN